MELAINGLEAFPYLAAATDEPAVRVLTRRGTATGSTTRWTQSTKW